MIKRLVLMFVVLGLLAVTAQADPIFFGMCKMTLDAGDSDGIGIGGKFDLGMPLGERMILRGTYEAYKTAEGDGFDNGYTGMTVLSGILWDNLKMGTYLTVQGGVSKLTGLPVEFSSLSSLGTYFVVGEHTKLWLGGDYSTVVDQAQIWAFTIGMSIEAPWKREE